MKMGVPHVKTFCCFTSLKMGTLLITYITHFMSFVTFVWWASNAYIMYRRVQHQDVEADNSHVSLAWIHVSLGIVAVLVQVSLGCILWTGMTKDDCRYFKLYLVMCIVAILLNIALTIIGAFITRYTLAYPLGFGIPLQLYFLLVIHSAVKEMENEQAVTQPSLQEECNDDGLQNEPI